MAGGIEVARAGPRASRAVSEDVRAPQVARVRPRELAIALAPCLVLAGAVSVAWPVTIDDAFISLRHASNLVAHGVLSFDPHERIEGYSNFSLVLLAASLLAAGIEPLPWIKGLGSLAGLACVPLGYLLARRIGVPHPFALLGALLLACHTGLAFWSAAGLETALQALLVTTGVLLLLRSRPGSDLGAAVLFAFAALTRIEAPVLFAALALERVGREWSRGAGAAQLARRHAPWLALFALLYGAYFLWRLWYFGHLFPNPVYFKRAAGLDALGASYSVVFVASSWPLLTLAVVSLVRRSWIQRVPLAVVAAALATFLSARTLVLQDVSTMGFYDRYFVPVLPCLVAAAMLGLAWLWERTRARPAARLLCLVGAASLVAWQLANPGGSWVHMLGRARSYPPAVAARNVPTAAYLDARFGPHGRIVAGDVGRLGWGYRGSVDDLFGLNSYAFTLRFAGDVHSYAAYLLEREPDAIVLCRDAAARPCHHAEAVLAGLPTFAARYRETRRFGADVVPDATFFVYERSIEER